MNGWLVGWLYVRCACSFFILISSIWGTRFQGENGNEEVDFIIDDREMCEMKKTKKEKRGAEERIMS